MRVLIAIICVFASTFVFSQNKEIKLVTKIDYGLHYSSVNGDYIASLSFSLGFDFSNENSNSIIYLTYNSMRNTMRNPLYKGHYLGSTFEHYFLNDEKRFRPFLGLTFLSEINSNYIQGFITDSSFHTTDSHANWQGSYPNYYNAAGVYYSTPFFGKVSLGFGVCLIKNLHLNFSLGYGIQIMRYKYLEWDKYDDYQVMLQETPMKTRMIHYINAQLGLRYAFSFKTKPKKE